MPRSKTFIQGLRNYWTQNLAMQNLLTQIWQICVDFSFAIYSHNKSKIMSLIIWQRARAAYMLSLCCRLVKLDLLITSILINMDSTACSDLIHLKLASPSSIINPTPCGKHWLRPSPRGRSLCIEPGLFAVTLVLLHYGVDWWLSSFW